MSRHSKVIARTDTQIDTQTHRQYENITFPHTRAVTKKVLSVRLFRSARLSQHHINGY